MAGSRRASGLAGADAGPEYQNISYNNLEKAALLSSGVGSFVLVAKKLNGQRIADCITKALPAMRDFAKATTRPFIAKIYADSRVLAQLGAEKP